MEPENHPFAKESHLPNPFLVIPAVSFRGGVVVFTFLPPIETGRCSVETLAAALGRREDDLEGTQQFSHQVGPRGWIFGWVGFMLGCPRKLGSMFWKKLVIWPVYKWGILAWNNPLILTSNGTSKWVVNFWKRLFGEADLENLSKSLRSVGRQALFWT